MSQVKILNNRILPDITDIIMDFNMPKKEDIKYLKFKNMKKLKKEFRKKLNYENILKIYRKSHRKTVWSKCALCKCITFTYEYIGKNDTRIYLQYCDFCKGYFN